MAEVRIAPESTPADQYQVVIVRYGTRVGARSQVFLNYEIYRQADAPIDMDYFVWVIRNAERTVLVDTGFSRHGGEEVRGRTFVIEPADAYRALGIDLQDEFDIVVTHAHYDHIGNLARFPNARIHIAARELEFWTSDVARRAQFAYSAEDEEVAALAAADVEGRVRTFEGELRLAPGIDVIEVGGHTPGQSIVRVATADGDVLLASDAIHYYEEYDADLPFAFVADLPAMYRGFDRIRGLVADGVRHLVPGHDPDTLARFARIETGPLAGIAATIGTAPADGDVTTEGSR